LDHNETIRCEEELKRLLASTQCLIGTLSYYGGTKHQAVLSAWEKSGLSIAQFEGCEMEISKMLSNIEIKSDNGVEKLHFPTPGDAKFVYKSHISNLLIPKSSPAESLKYCILNFEILRMEIQFSKVLDHFSCSASLFLWQFNIVTRVLEPLFFAKPFQDFHFFCHSSWWHFCLYFLCH
jgi:hypothetical protein